MKNLRWPIVAACLALGAGAQSAMLFDRGLPKDNLNNDAGANRSNVAWGYGQTATDQYYTGDDFRLSAAGLTGLYKIDTITVWATGGSPTDAEFQLGDRFKDLTLYLGNAVDGMHVAQTGLLSTDSNASGNSDIHISQVLYEGGQTYQGSTGSMIRLWQIDFTNLNLTVDADDLVYFGVNGTMRDMTVNNTWFNHASNAGLGGSAHQGSDNLYRWFYVQDPTANGVVNSLGNGWDKSSDINVQVTGEAVPEPFTMALCAGGLLLALKRRRK